MKKTLNLNVKQIESIEKLKVCLAVGFCLEECSEDEIEAITNSWDMFEMTGAFEQLFALSDDAIYGLAVALGILISVKQPERIEQFEKNTLEQIGIAGNDGFDKALRDTFSNL